MSRARALAGIAFAVVHGCSGETLRIGQGRLDPDSNAASDLSGCDAPPGKPLPEGPSRRARRAAADELLIGRWVACPGSPRPPDVPAAIEFTGDRAYVLNETFERLDEGTRYSTGWGLADDVLVIDLGGSSADAGAVLPTSYDAFFEDAPVRMTWLPTETRFLKR